jgi:iron complex outermembrane receptor protein
MNKRRMLLSGAACIAFALPAMGQTSLEEIVVTAQKRSESLQDVPVAITALTAETLEKLDVRDVQDLPAVTPGLQIKTSDASANPKIFIRGVGLNDFNANAAGAVGIYFDGVYVASPLAQLGQFFDLDRVEVLKGPQGTLYGRNTTGGTVNLAPKQPSFAPSFDGSVEYGNADTTKAEMSAGGTLVDNKLAARIAGTYEKDDGDMLNRLTGHTLNATDRWAGRASFLYTPSDDLDVTLQIHGGQNKGDSRYTYVRPLIPQTAQATGPDGLCRPSFYNSGQCTDVLGYANTGGNPYAGDFGLEGHDDVDLYGLALNVRWAVGKVTLYSVTGYDFASRNDLEDTDASPNDEFHSTYRAVQKDFSQEFRIEAPLFDHARAVAGLYYLHDDLSTDSEYDVLGALRPMFVTPQDPTGFSLVNDVALVGFPYTQSTDGGAVFGQVDVDVTDKVTVTGGLRYSDDYKKFSYESTAEQAFEIFSIDEAKNFSSVSGRAAAEWRPTDQAMIYVSYNRGYKSGGFFGGYTRDPADLAPYKDETVNAYEVGSKTEWFDHRLRVNGAGFYYDYQNLQEFQLVERDGLTVQTYNNASNARVYGVDGDVSAIPLEGLELSLGAEYLNTEFLNYISYGEDLSGNRLPSAPRWSLSGIVDYDRPIGDLGSLNAMLAMSYRSTVYFDSHQEFRLSQEGYWLTDARVGWTAPNGKVSAGLWVRNLFDKTYVVDINNLDSFGFDALSMGTPRRFGGYVKWHF